MPTSIPVQVTEYCHSQALAQTPLIVHAAAGGPQAALFGIQVSPGGHALVQGPMAPEKESETVKQVAAWATPTAIYGAEWEVALVSVSKVTTGSVLTSSTCPADPVADPTIFTAGEKSVSPPPFSMMNSADCPSVMHPGNVGLAEQSGNAFTEEHGEPGYVVQLTIAPEVISWKKAHP
jgi:hypothetical protein